MSEPITCHPAISHVSAVLPLDARVHRCGNIGTFCNSNLDTKPPLHFSPQGNFFSSNSSVVFAKIADDRQQTTRGERNVTTLPHSSSGSQHHLCARGVSSLCCGEFLVSESLSFVTPPYHTFLPCCPLDARVHRCGNIGTFVIVIL